MIANEIVSAFNERFGLPITPLSDQEILDAGGTFVHTPGQLSDSNKWVQIRQKGNNRCLMIKSDNNNMTVKRCSSNSNQRWYVIPYNGGYMLRSAYTVSGHFQGTCIVDDG